MQIFNTICDAIKTDRSSRFLLIALVGILVTTFSLRLINLDADPVPWFTGELGYQIDEGYKTLSPRNLYLFGETHWNEADEYRGWMKASAMTQWPYYLSFKTFGEELSSARLVSVIYAVSFLILAAFFLWQRVPRNLAVLGILLLATDPALFLYSRSALFETSIIFYVYAGIFITAAITPNIRPLAFIPLILIAIASFYYLKQSVLLYFLPIALSIIIISMRSWFKPTLTYKIVITSLALVALAGLFMFIDAKQGSSVNINLGKFLSSPQTLFLNPVHMLSPFALIISYAIIVELSIRQPNFLFENWYRLSLVAILLLVPIMLTFFTYNVPRYNLPVLPAAFLLIIERFSLNLTSAGAIGADLTSHDATKNKITRASWFSLEKLLTAIAFFSLTMTIIATSNYYILSNIPINIGDDPGLSDLALIKIFPIALIFFVLAAYFIVRPCWGTIETKLYQTFSTVHVIIGIAIVAVAVAIPTYQSQDIKQALSQHVKPNESIGGDWAPFFVADTQLRGLYMRPDFNSAEHTEHLRPDYFLHSTSPYDNKNFNNLKKINTIKVGGAIDLGTYADHKLTLYPIEYPSIEH